MKIHRFILPNIDFSKTVQRIHEADFFNQIKNVLKIKPGEKIIVSNGKNQEALCTVLKFEKQEIEIEMIEILHNENESTIHSRLYCSLLKKENFELVCQKATEIGVKEIYPIITSRTIKTGFDRKRLEKIIQEAAEQSGRLALPMLHEPKNIRDAIAKAAQQHEVNILFDSQGEQLQSGDTKNKNVGYFIGPEGGFSQEEKELAIKNNFQIVSLGKLTLRAETAAIIASYLAVMI